MRQLLQCKQKTFSFVICCLSGRPSNCIIDDGDDCVLCGWLAAVARMLTLILKTILKIGTCTAAFLLFLTLFLEIAAIVGWARTTQEIHAMIKYFEIIYKY